MSAYLRIQLECVARICDRSGVLQPFGALRQTPDGMFVCVGRHDCTQRCFEAARAA